jgi:hypothetical protein
MKKLSGIAALLAMTFLAGTAASKENWQVIGTVTYDAPLQKAVIDAGKGNGKFDAIRLEVKLADVEIADLKVIYGNGQVDDIAVRDVFKAGSSSRRIDLKRGSRLIRQIIVTYRANGRARIAVLGDAAGVTQPEWIGLGCNAVDFAIDRDAIKVGRQDGTFTKLKLSVTGNPVEFTDARVVYGNGQHDTLKIRSVIRPGGETRPLDLAGKARGIDRVELLYRSLPAFKGKAKVCASGLQAQ